MRERRKRKREKRKEKGKGKIGKTESTRALALSAPLSLFVSA